MSRFNRTFIITVILADILALIYFGGSFVLTGSILPHGPAHAEKSYIIAEEKTQTPALAKAEVVKVAIVPNPEKGAKVAGKCKACHTFEAGGSNRIGPALWGIVGQKAGSVGGFGYSTVMANYGKNWEVENLDAFLKSPKKYMPGTKMAFAGLRKEEDRVHLIAWLETLK